MLKNKKMRTILIFCMFFIISITTTVFSKQMTEMINVMYDNIKIVINGEEYIAKDVNGNTVEPFIYNGTTYLPVRAIANAFDVNVNWDEANSTVELGYSKVDYLSQLSYVDYTTNQDTAKFSIYDTYGLEFKLNWSYGELATQTVTYKLNDNYSKFICALEGTGSNGPGAYINIYGNNKQLLYASPCVNNKSAEIPVNFDINGQKILYIEIINAAGESEGAVRLKNAKIVR